MPSGSYPPGCTQRDHDDAWGDGPTREQVRRGREEYLMDIGDEDMTEPQMFQSIEEFSAHWASTPEIAQITTRHAPWFENAFKRTAATIRSLFAEREAAISLVAKLQARIAELEASDKGVMALLLTQTRTENATLRTFIAGLGCEKPSRLESFAARTLENRGLADCQTQALPRSEWCLPCLCAKPEGQTG